MYGHLDGHIDIRTDPNCILIFLKKDSTAMSGYPVSEPTLVTAYESNSHLFSV